MKPVLILVAFVAAVSTGAPTVDLTKINWAQLTKDLEEINTVTPVAFNFIVEEATRGDAAIGAQLRTTFNAFVAKTIANNPDKKIADHTWTYDEAEKYFEYSKSTMDDLHAEILKIIAKLPAANIDKIEQKWETTYTKAAGLGYKIHQLYNAAKTK